MKTILSFFDSDQPYYSKHEKHYPWMLLFLAIGLFAYLLRSVDYFIAVPGDLGDARFNSVILEHLFMWVQGSEPNLWSPRFFYPFEGALGFSDNHFGSAIFYIIFRFLGLSRELAFDGWFFTGNCLNFFSLYLVLRKFGFSGFCSAAGAFVFAFSLPVLPKEGHAQLVYRFAIPFAYEAFWNLLSKRCINHLFPVIFWTTIQFYCSIYLGIFTLYLLLATFVSYLFLRPSLFFSQLLQSIRDQKLIALFFIFLGVSLCLLSVGWLLFQYMAISADYGFIKSKFELSTMLPRISSYFIADRVSYPSWFGKLTAGIPMRHEHQMFFGFGVWIIFIFGIFSVWKYHIHQTLGKVNSLSLIILFIVSLSAGGFSFYYLLMHIPGISAIRAVSRIVLIMMFPVSIIVAICTERLLSIIDKKNYFIKRSVIIGLIFLLSLEVFLYRPVNTPINLWQSRQSKLNALAPAHLPEGSIVYVTQKEDEPFYLTELDGMIFSQDRNLPTLNGYSGNIPPGYLEPAPCLSFMTRLNAYRDFRKVPQKNIDAVAKSVIQLDFSPCTQEPAIAFAGYIPATLAKNIRLQFLDITLSTHQFVAKVNIINNSSETFSTLSLDHPPHPVRLSWRFLPLSEKSTILMSDVGWDPRKDLVITLHPDDNHEFSLSGALPAVAGRYKLEISLVQEGVAWFHDLGMEPANINLNF